MKFKYNLNDIPPFPELVLFGLQWLAIAVPTIIIIGNVVSGLQPGDPFFRINYLQKLFFLTAVILLAQITLGHRLPLITGPAAVLLAGITASQGTSTASIYTAIITGGLALFILSATGLFSRLKNSFTPRVVATILILIALTLTPLILNLIVGPGTSTTPLANLLFALSFVILMFVANRFLRGIWKSTLIIWAIIAGTLAYYALFPETHLVYTQNLNPVSLFFKDLNYNLTFEPGVIISFMICFLALSINDLGSIQSLGELIQPDNMPQRITRGISITGLANVLSGFMGVIGPVNFSLSPGVIASTSCASRFTLIPAGIFLLALSFFPSVISIIGSVPSVVTGTVLIYIMCSQISAGLMLAFNPTTGFKFDNGLVMGLPLMLGIVISFLPGDVLNTFPPALRPVMGNGFVVGVLSVLIMEHIIFKEQKNTDKKALTQ
ncbi:xanthine permease [Desulfocucumis palustris]|uniref:Xanthine permease n=1 Tax=Desulfocucumis palustris TaxID=1898651 RepID=A0A2L2XHR4_9FIRM|nr:solute carrier family 23 protein [Desulfocucumis palustris]GBF35745.1 xanthine permease [Desulfocucumis palustris]